MSRLLVGLGAVLALLGAFAAAQRCGTGGPGAARRAAVRPGEPLPVVATTGMIADAVRAVGGDRIRVTALMGPGIDPHLYKASEGDVTRMSDARMIFFNGLHLEGKMAELLEQLRGRGALTVAVTDGISRARLRRAGEFQGSYDPHVWFDVGLWMEAVRHIRDALVAADPGDAAGHRRRADRYLAELEALDREVAAQVALIPPARRVLITAHDAFGYFGRAYGLEVRGVQGLTTTAEAGAADVQQLADFIARRRIPALFVESSVPPRILEAVSAAVRARGARVGIGGQLYSDALGDAGTPAGTYVGMVRQNVDTIVRALRGPLEARPADPGRSPHERG